MPCSESSWKTTSTNPLKVRRIKARHMHRRMLSAMAKKQIPKFKTDKEAEAFVHKADLTKSTFHGSKPCASEFEKKRSSKPKPADT